jgi:hypothetical protein
MQKIIAISTCFLQKINISSIKPSKTIQKFRCTLTNLNTADEVTRIGGSPYALNTLLCLIQMLFNNQNAFSELRSIKNTKEHRTEPSSDPKGQNVPFCKKIFKLISDTFYF